MFILSYLGLWPAADTPDILLNCFVYHDEPSLSRVFQVKIAHNATVDQLRDEIWKKKPSWQYLDANAFTLYLPPFRIETTKFCFEAFIPDMWLEGEFGQEFVMNPTEKVDKYVSLEDAREQKLHIVVKTPQNPKSSTMPRADSW
ncbi:hypothetical protein AX16_003922 [Volvariella volvacea WC 439]|nr:hypothetical protein AX16_003922 [Volvariella volvacea WC 439]